MKTNIKKYLSLLLVLVLALFVFGQSAFACTSVFAGKGATADGSVLMARTEDISSAWPKHFAVYPRLKHEKGAMQSFYNGLEVPQPEESFKYFALPDWDDSEGPFSEVGINEYGVAISATNSARANEKVLKADPFIDEGVGETHMPDLILPRVKTAREGVELLGQYTEKYGALEGNGLAIADKDEIWYMEIGSGHHWVALRIPDDKYLIVANQFRIDKVDTTDKENYLTSKGILEFLKKNEIIKDETTFDFAECFGVLGEKYNTRREWGAQHLLTPSAKQSGDLERYPLLMTPDKKITPKDAMKVLRYRYEGTKYDANKNKEERAIGIDRTAEAHVIQLRKDMPNEISGLMWLSIGNPEYGVFTPFYAGMTEVPELYGIGTEEYDAQSAYWAFRGAATLAQTDIEKYGLGLKKFWDKYENQLLERQGYIDKIALEMYKKDKDKAISFVTDYSNQVGLHAVNKAKELRNEIMSIIASQASGVFDPEL